LSLICVGGTLTRRRALLLNRHLYSMQLSPGHRDEEMIFVKSPASAAGLAYACTVRILMLRRR